MANLDPASELANQGLFWTKWGVIAGIVIGAATLSVTLYMAIPIFLARKKDRLSKIEKAILKAAWRDTGTFGQGILLFDGWPFDRHQDRFIALHLGSKFITDKGEIDHLLVLGLLQEGRPPCASVELGNKGGLQPRWYSITPAGRQLASGFNSELITQVLMQYGEIFWE